DGERGESSVRAMHALSAFRVPAGEHEVSVRFVSGSWRIGCMVTAVGLIGVIVWCVWVLKRQKGRAHLDKFNELNLPCIPPDLRGEG
ncbi:MAG TPA: hypothetical protein PKJ23_12570, partial [bacterium]|nr:hypothetical protein [bacterium]